jgi:serpin B
MTMKKLVLALGLVGCAAQPDVLEARKIPTALAPDVAQVVAANNQFAIDLYRQAAPSAPNLIMSPFSVSTAFAMLDAGAATTSDAELRSTFHWNLAGAQLHAAYGALLTSIDAGRTYGNYTLATANKLFGAQGFPFAQPFLDITKTDYNAELQPVDFANHADQAVDTIDQWVSDQTDAKIPQLFMHGDLDASTVLALVNAILFKGTWEHPFDVAKTANAPFTRGDGSMVQAPTMTKEDALATTSIPNGSLVILPFAGKDLEMVILLPDAADGLPALEAALTGDQLSSWIAAAVPSDEPHGFTLPKFKLELPIDLATTLPALGVTTIWQPDTADLSGIDGARDLYVTKAVHQAMISVDEHGAEAAAATGISVGDSGSSGPFRIDHPFVFALHDAVTNSILFIGRVEDPTL